MGVDQLLDFLAQNSLNAFLYEYQNGRGISSVVDHALAVKRPLALTRSSMFRHVNGTRPPITMEDARLSDILARGFTPLARYARGVDAENLRWDYERIVDSRASPGAHDGGRRSPGGRSRAGPADLDEVARKVVRPRPRCCARWSSSCWNRPMASESAQEIRRVALAARRRAGAAATRSAAPRPRAGAAPAPTGSRAGRRQRGRSGARRDAPSRPVSLPVAGPSVNGLNRILDRSAFTTYEPAIDYLFRHMPEIMARKIPAANIQQAFVLDTVMRLVPRPTASRPCCVSAAMRTRPPGRSRSAA